MSASVENLPTLEVIDLACRMHGKKRGFHLAATLLGISERVVKAIVYGERDSQVCPIAARKARNTLARQRREQLRAELAQLEGTANAEISVDRRCQGVGVGR